jgi:hypothetical protein
VTWAGHPTDKSVPSFSEPPRRLCAPRRRLTLLDLRWPPPRFTEPLPAPEDGDKPPAPLRSAALGKPASWHVQHATAVDFADMARSTGLTPILGRFDEGFA